MHASSANLPQLVLACAWLHTLTATMHTTSVHSLPWQVLLQASMHIYLLMHTAAHTAAVSAGYPHPRRQKQTQVLHCQPHHSALRS
jgi:hypothetical protein